MSAPSALELFVRKVERSLDDDSFIRLVLSSPSPEVHPVQRVEGRLVRIQNSPVVSLTTREPTRDLVHNFAPTEAGAWLRSELTNRFHGAWLETTRRDWQFFSPAGRPSRLASHSPRHTTAPARLHDQIKTPSLAASAADWLGALGIVDEHGRPLPRHTAKHRQVQRFAEILGHLVTDGPWGPRKDLVVADMGCGRGILTFAAWQLLRRDRGFETEVVGIELREPLVRAANEIASRLGLTGLRFATGTIADVQLPRLDILIALHACNTATDDAIRRGIDREAGLIVVAPCCHQEIRPQLGFPGPLAPVLRHGIMADRMAEWVTDGLRALHLEWAGYETSLVEFVASEHTPKNLLLAGVRRKPSFADPAARDRIVALKRHFEIDHHALDPFLGR